MGNYRPVSLVPIFSKIIECVIKDQVDGFFSENCLFNSKQFGYRPGISTTDAVGRLLSATTAGFEEGHSTCAILCDLSKAFDCLDHDILLKKLEVCGVKGIQNKIFRSYLSHRFQQVCVNGETSTATEIKFGVPQGSVLGPFLFLVMINDLPSNVSCDSVMFADDATFFFSNHVVELLKTEKELVLEEAAKWYSVNKFVLNVDKTQCITFSSNRAVREASEGEKTVKLLGIYLDDSLSWDKHISHVCKKLARLIFLFRRLRDCLPSHYIKVCYFALVQSTLLYGLIFWGNGTRINEVLILQKRLVRVLCGVPESAHCKPLFVQEGILTVISLFILECLMHAKRNHRHLALVSDVHGHNTRNQYKISQPFCRLSKTQSFYEYQSIAMFNMLPKITHELSDVKFKQAVKGWLVRRPFYNLTEFYQSDVTMLN